MSTTTTTKWSPTAYSDANTTTIPTTDRVTSPVTCTSITTIMGSVIGILVALQADTLIILYFAVVYWKCSMKSKQRCVWIVNNKPIA